MTETTISNAAPAATVSIDEPTKALPTLFEAQEVFVPRRLKLLEILDEHERSHWLIDEADMRIDVEQWKSGKISDEEKAFIKMILRLFTQSDKNVEDAYVDRLLPLFKNPEARMMLLSFAAREVTHVRGYKRLNDTLGYDSNEFMTEFLGYSEMKAKHQFMTEQVDLSTPAATALYLAKQILMEGVSLFGSFAMLLTFAKEGKLPGMVSVNKWSILEESMHARGLTELFLELVEANPHIVNNHFKAAIYEYARQVIGLEDAFISLAHTVGKSNVATEQEFKDYVRYVCDYCMNKLGLKSQFGVKTNPIDWIDDITGNTMANFFEATSVEYSKASLTGEWVY